MDEPLELLKKIVNAIDAKKADQKDGGNTFAIWMKSQTTKVSAEEAIEDARLLIEREGQKASTSDSKLPVAGVGETCVHPWDSIVRDGEDDFSCGECGEEFEC